MNAENDVTVFVDGGDNDTIRNIENVIGTAGADTISGDAAANTLTGLDGDDIIRGGGGSDVLSGGDGANDECDGCVGDPRPIDFEYLDCQSEEQVHRSQAKE